ncbi:hypothetical protein TL16_g07400 [Triparma laevis f. inornata]|uniref:Uncharacterized protein n=2 Tax=Triparma laevis TaxID=1534972 RepID=A0A9W7AQN4_9STRA|nr:hypothetical protein TL16_g07400 [Triparma laevis f. inornata]
MLHKPALFTTTPTPQSSPPIMRKSVKELEAKRDQMLALQRDVSKKFNAVLTKKGGLNDTSFMVKKNLQAAIAVAQQPGFFEYYQPSAEVKAVESTNELKKLTQKIKRMQKEIDQVNSEIVVARPKKSDPPPPAIVSGFDQWFNNYGKPKPSPHGFMSQFQEDPKIYGGTGHHSGFRTRARMMRKGTITR